jgi:CubicO group peptidase (beta-lactamase class C family)
LYENYLGKRSVEFNANFTAESQFRICSNTKLFSAVSIMQLVERQVISSVHDNIADYLDPSDLAAWGLDSSKPFCPTIINSTVCQNITFVSLLSMSSGIIPAVVCDFQPDQWQYKYCLSLNQQLVYPGSIAQTIALFIGSPLQFAPGPTYGPDPDSPNTYQYANENFIVLSYFIQKLSKMSLQDYYQTHIFDVVGLHSTTFDPYSQAFTTIKQPTSEYFYYTDLTQSDEPFAMGSCTSVEVCSRCLWRSLVMSHRSIQDSRQGQAA